MNRRSSSQAFPSRRRSRPSISSRLSYVNPAAERAEAVSPVDGAAHEIQDEIEEIKRYEVYHKVELVL